jgi:hypothetical protein
MWTGRIASGGVGMALDLHSTAVQLEVLSRWQRNVRGQHAARLDRAFELLRTVSGYDLNAHVEASAGRFNFLPAGLATDPNTGVAGDPGERHEASRVPDDFCVMSVDGSHIDVDRHIPIRCYLINLGGCVLNYGHSHDAYLFSEPSLPATERELYLQDTGSESRFHEQPLEGALLGLKRTVEEASALARLVKNKAPSDRPVLALLDGSLILWQLGGGQQNQYPDFVRRAFLQDGIVEALESIRNISERSTIAAASYISLPNARDVVNLLRLAQCDYSPLGDCSRHCRTTLPGERHCDTVHSLTDRDLFARLLAPGERSTLFYTRSSVVRDHYGPPAAGFPLPERPHAIGFFYLNVGQEIARVEVPAWVASNETLLSLTHTLVLDQARRGDGYPPAIQEAHEQAVLTGTDRALFQSLLMEVLEEAKLPVYTSEKQRSKRYRSV